MPALLLVAVFVSVSCYCLVLCARVAVCDRCCLLLVLLLCVGVASCCLLLVSLLLFGAVADAAFFTSR